ncbi:MAG: phosphoenolpyruvate--protein phosphotransferase [Eubacteriaceae bacterium]|jgi:phosphotransferase system enzyme I (PtsI)
MLVKEGISASPGIAIAKAMIYQKASIDVDDTNALDSDEELKKLKLALNVSGQQIKRIGDKVSKELGEDEALIFQAHGMILDDPEFLEAIEIEIKEHRAQTVNAVILVTKRYSEMFEQLEDQYFRARAADIADVGNRLRNNLLGVEQVDCSNLDEDVIIIADDLSPSDTAQMDKKRVRGFATDIGSRTSHSAIMARSLEIPAVLGLKDISSVIKTGDIIILDGISGCVIINPNQQQLEKAKEKQQEYQKRMEKRLQLKEQQAITLDGHIVELVGNIGEPSDVAGVIKNGGTGIGLYRTEFLYMNSDVFPDEEKQLKAYKSAIEAFPQGSVIIRTMDIGGDKKLPYLPLEEELNPFLGLRALRLCFNEIELFKTQLRAILRASIYGNACIMFPMISSVEEVRKAKAILEVCKKDLITAGLTFNEEVKVGVMIEIPSAAITADIIAQEVDFFSIGTNDLCQYTLAVDRMNENVSYLYDHFHPAILKLIKQVIDASSQSPNTFTGMCGEMAGDPLAAVILLGLGLDEFSMSASTIPLIKEIIRQVRFEEVKEVAKKVLEMETSEEVTNYVFKFLKNSGITF